MENAASRFGQHLAHTEKKYRDRALKKLTVYLTKKTEWTSLEWDKLWKALFYCMWMSDKRPVQDELSTNLAALVHQIPRANLALAFVHSFFCTMHREWHGLDGLRLDKFYSLVRKFVRETVALLRLEDWNDTLVHHFVTILSTEVVSQSPNGLRLHLADIYLTEIYTAAKDVTTEAFVTLFEPFLTLLSCEYDKTVFKRVRALVFEDMVKKCQFQPPVEKREENKEETDTEEDTMVFERVDLAQVQHRIFAIASADDTPERNRAALYTLYKKFVSVTHVDSLQSVLKQVKEATKGVEDKPIASDCCVKEKEVSETRRVEKVKKRKAPKVDDVEAKGEKEKEAKSMALKKVKVEEIKTRSAGKGPEMPEPITAKAPVLATEKPKQEKKSLTTVTTSGRRFKRCIVCGGFGKGLVPTNKPLCGHCERAQKTQKKVATFSSKKRKAACLAQSTRKEPVKIELSKQVTFGKSKTLRHEVSVKRLRASAKREAVVKDTETIKGVLKRSTPSGVKTIKTTINKKRKTAADFM